VTKFIVEYEVVNAFNMEVDADDFQGAEERFKALTGPNARIVRTHLAVPRRVVSSAPAHRREV